MRAENEKRYGQGHHHSSTLDNSTLVSKAYGHIGRHASYYSKEERFAEITASTNVSSSRRQTRVDSLQSVRDSFRKRGFSEDSTRIFMLSWKSGTKKQYNTHITRWFRYCTERKITPVSPTLEEVVEFLTNQFNKGLGYESLNTARGALSAFGIQFEGFRIGNHPLIIRFMKGVFAARPTKSRYTEVWDVNKVLIYLKKLSPVRHLSLKNLTLKLVMLMALTQAARVQTLQLISYTDYKKLKSEFVFKFDGLLKHNRPNHNINFISFKAYPPDRRLCIYTVLKEYLARTSNVRIDNNAKKLLLSYVKPYKNVTKDTISRWIKTVMYRSGINIAKYGSHSVRAAAASKAKNSGVPVAVILEKAGWSSESTFAKFYDKAINTGRDPFQEGVLRH
ncbi:uncharacterized protein LOC132746632 [Ruditapes philippinarum]|uniref:uncharacterized protein LOC132746632 n=1 Tax=Ruditapes philippinarum TaxID=129788 RepID=UPI00295A960B|nr:uncharacterized protein LOC132746632 [Ruditapes philippinarum]